MRITGGHALGEEAAGLVKQAVSLAGRRGHTQVTPLHIASAMLSAASPAGILRAACVRSQSHPLQHNALELCLNLALDRLAVPGPASSAAHCGAGSSVRVDLAPSNAFAAVLKRAKAHRRGAKVEIEQLVLSILDDPSIDRVMRAAGFSSSQLVRASVETAVLSEQSDRAAGQPSLQTVHRSVMAHVPDHGRSSYAGTLHNSSGFYCEIQASRAKACGKIIATTAILPPWLRRYREAIPTRSKRYGTTTLQVDLDTHRRPKFTELTAHNLKTLCDALELRCPGHGDMVPGLSSTVLLCRSGMIRRRRARKQPSTPLSATTWLLFRGRDSGVKTAVARELARLVFGSHADFIAMQAGNSDEPTHSGKLTLKRRRSPGDCSGGYAGARLAEEMVENPHRVIYIDGADRMDRDSEMRIKDAMVEGTVRGCNGDVVGLEDAIVVLCSDVLDSWSVVSSPQAKRRPEEGDATGKELRPCRRLRLDLNACPEDGEDEEDHLADDEDLLNFVDDVFFFN